MKRNFWFAILVVIASAAASAVTVNRMLRSVGTEHPVPAGSGGSPAAFAGADARTVRAAAAPDFTAAAERSVRGVVYVEVLKRTERGYAPTILDLLFGYGGASPREQAASGSGVIVTEDGYVVTNYHVVAGATEIQVTTDDRRSFAARLVGSDPATDVALLKIDASGLPALPLGDSDGLQLGEWVLAIGSPYGLRSTVTAGIVSAKGRSMPNPDGEFRIESFIQTDAAVNAGNSGGALVNIDGELVGINTAIVSATGSYAGYSFAVPVNIVRKIAEDLIDFGHVQRAVLGVSMLPMTTALARERGFESLDGVYLAEVLPGAAADQGGVKSGDVLLAVDSVAVASPSEVQERIARYRPGDVVELALLRRDRRVDLRVRLMGADGAAVSAAAGTESLFGADLRTARPEQLRRLGLRRGVEVVSVGDGKMKEAGVREGLIITYVDNRSVDSPADVLKAVHRSRRSVLLEGVYPDGSVYYYGIGL